MSTLTVLRKVLARLTPYRALFLLAVLQVVAIGVLELAKPWPLKLVVDNVLGGQRVGWATLDALDIVAERAGLAPLRPFRPAPPRAGAEAA